MGSNALKISDLPVEILQLIFTNLSTKERKTVKLVCQTWLEICNGLSLSNDEVLNCLGIYQLSDIYELLNRSKRSYLNLKFDFVKFNEDSSFWRNNGSRIRSIAFKDCWFYNRLDEIIICCENLFNLSFTYTTPPFPYKRWDDYPRFNLLSSHKFEALIEKGIVRENLNSLKIDVRYRTLINLSEGTMCQLFSIFPRVKILKLIYHDYGSFNDFDYGSFNDFEPLYVDAVPVRDYSDFTLTPVLSYLTAAKDRIEKLKLHFPLARLSPTELRSILDTLTVMKRLTELSINLGHVLQPEVMETFLISKPLKSLVYSQLGPFPLESLLSNSSLEHLEFGDSVDSSITTKSLLDTLMSSNLRSCKIVINNDILIQDPASFDSGFSTATTLPKLSVRVNRSWPTPGQSPREMVQFLQYFQNLRHLLINDISYNELQSLLRYQTKLKSLIMKEEGQLKYLSENRVEVFKNAFSQLTELEHLELSHSVAYVFLKSLSPGSVLTNLKYLKLSFSADAFHMISPPDFLKLADAVPFLEGLYVHDSRNIPFAVCAKLCTELSRLRFLRWDTCPVNEHFSTDQVFRELFSMCPSLRLLIYTSTVEYIYFWDIINEKVVCILQNDDNNKPYTLVKPKIGGYKVDWLTFLKKNLCEKKLSMGRCRFQILPLFRNTTLWFEFQN